jgi:hypothetical protein
MTKLCEFENCRRQAYYATVFDTPTHCKEHKLDGQRVRYDICKCGNAGPIFGLKDDNRASCCKLCRTPDMIDKKNKKCHCGKSRPSYGLPNTKTLTHCFECKTDDMIDLNNKKKLCVECHKVRATFGLIKGKATHCVTCKDKIMNNVLDTMCLGCNIVKPTFGFTDDSKPTYCFTCRLDGMINIKDNKCPCGTIATFGLVEDKAPSCCKLCKTPEMITIWKRKCLTCEVREPRYGNEGDKLPTYCSDCKTEEMINFYDNLCPCGTHACFGFEGDKKATCCEKCKKDGMKNITVTKCKANLQGITCTQYGNRKYKWYCTHCFAHLFPLDPLTFQIRCKTKELAVRDYINSVYTDFIHDKTLWIDGCNCTHKRRIDHRKLIGNTLLCIETDENQHKRYDKIDEQYRYDDLMMVHGGKFIFIRFNPDKYKEKNVNKNPTISTRLIELSKEIDKQVKRIENEENTSLLEIVYMYYDDE